jgi:hypothetical protein
MYLPILDHGINYKKSSVKTIGQGDEKRINPIGLEQLVQFVPVSNNIIINKFFPQYPAM